VKVGTPSRINSVDNLLERFTASAGARTVPVAGPEEGGRERVQDLKIITPTLAEIYAQQGKVTEAIEAYQRLLALRPSEGDRFRTRITELQQLRREE
jgi:tetratricopeptide (TPR) repeat protein